MKKHKFIPKVVTVGPDSSGSGGIAAVLRMYGRTISNFKYLCSNSRHGTFVGMIRLFILLAKLPFLRLAGYNTVHAHGAVGKSFIRKRIILGWSKVWGYRTIFHCHGAEFVKYAAKVGNDKMSRILRSYSAVVALSDSWRSFFVNTLGCDNVYTVKNIIEDNPVKRKPLANKPLRLLILGRVGPRKGTFDLLEAISILKKEGLEDIRLAVGGDGDVKEFLHRVNILGLNEMVEYLGLVFNEDKDAIIGQSHIVVLPSYFEGVPITLLEAGVNSMPSISTTVGGIPEVIVDGENGMLIEPGDIKALAAAIRTYYNNPSLIEKHGCEARRRISAHFPSEIERDLQRLYKSLS